MTSKKGHHFRKGEKEIFSKPNEKILCKCGCGTLINKFTYGRWKCETREKMFVVGHNSQLKGSDNPRWKGGITPINKKERTKFIREIRKQVFERDNYTCQMCKNRGVHLQVDHIQPWAEYVELRFSMNNCRTLCDRCHYKITFGKEMPKEIKTWGQNFKTLERRLN